MVDYRNWSQWLIVLCISIYVINGRPTTDIDNADVKKRGSGKGSEYMSFHFDP